MKRKKTNRKGKRTLKTRAKGGRRHRHRYAHETQQGIAVSELHRAYREAKAEYHRAGEALFRAKAG